MFVISWSPYLTKMEDMLEVLHRLFPFSRGLYEDKVANVWCTVSVMVKLRQWMTLPSLMSMATVSTLVASLPSCVHLLFNPTPYCFLLSLVSSVCVLSVCMCVCVCVWIWVCVCACTRVHVCVTFFAYFCYVLLHVQYYHTDSLCITIIAGEQFIVIFSLLISSPREEYSAGSNVSTIVCNCYPLCVCVYVTVLCALLCNCQCQCVYCITAL